MSEIKRYFLELSYKGTPFHGWQIQANAFTIQECIESALSTFFRSPIVIQGSGRTDTGVHASMQMCHFDTDLTFEKEKFLKAINGILPKEIAIHWIRQVKADAHARFHALSRSYIYRIVFRKDPFVDDLAWRCFYNPDLDQMNKAAEYLLQFDDFECFSKIRTEVKHFRCQIKSAYWEQKDGELLFHITANRFLRGMVRTIVGTLIEIGYHHRPAEEMKQIISDKKRVNAGKSAPAKGLFLSRIEYPTEIYLD